MVYIRSDHGGANADEVMQGEYQVVLFGPECILQSSVWREMLLSSVYQEKLVVCLAVDEARCITKW